MGRVKSVIDAEMYKHNLCFSLIIFTGEERYCTGRSFKDLRSSEIIEIVMYMM